ncbi:unnamed protein product [Menidia menidia]|uniref:(Atlantic silverside) hypothetical protein n=1 Tax=Menidia menidia TaxID=238744 RepID=A0A8S4AIL1_9TELE|nr:unnamed protein product [Menidia menidia]
MAKLWIHTAALLIFLAISSPSSQARSFQCMRQSDLVDALLLVCGERGSVFQPLTGHGSMQRREPSAGDENKDTTFHERIAMVVMKNILKRCCNVHCTLEELSEFCN